MPTCSPSHQSLPFALLAALVALCALASTAHARELYVGNYEANTVSVLDAATGAPIGAPIPTGDPSGPFTLAISPDGRRVYTANYDAGTISAIDTQTKALAGAPIPVGEGPIGIAISRDGTLGYVGNSDDGTVSVVNLVAGTVVGAPIPVPGSGGRPMNPILTPDGKKLYVPYSGGGEAVTVIDTATRQVIGAPIPTGNDPYMGAVTPDGRRVFVGDVGGAAVYVIDTATDQLVGAPIPVGDRPAGIAISPDGTRAYVASLESETVDVIDTQALVPLGTIKGAGEAEFAALTPDGRRGFVSHFSEGAVQMFDPLGVQLLGDPIPTGDGASGLAAVPNQPPVAAFSAPVRIRPGVATTFDAAGSTDPDGSVAGFAWGFGDGATAAVPAPQVSHAFARPGLYDVTLTVTDNEGCSAAYVFTGQTAYCNGSPVAVKTMQVSVAFPGVRVKCPKRAKPGGCKVRLQAVAWKGKGKNRRLKAQSAKAGKKLKAGSTWIASLKPKKAARNKLARAKKILVRETRTIDGKKRTKVRKLKVVR
jgi:YVTN family beta-propeller protein